MSNENVTVLTDEYGLQREYNEVQRRANVGERIKIVAAESTYDKYDNGDVFTVDRDATIGVECDAVISRNGNSSGLICDREYVVLVPTDIVRIGSGRYRLEQRKANVGERVVVTYARRYCFAVGEIYEVRTFDTAWGYAAYSVGKTYVLREEDSSVLVPVESAPLSAKPAQEQRDGIVANLAARVSALESEVAALKGRRHPLTEAFDALYKPSIPPVVERPLTRDNVSAPTRDDVIERAKRDVAELERKALAYPYETPATEKNGTLRIKFVINREKRTVVALTTCANLRDDWGAHDLPKGITKCAPDDVFNSHIGRAIALRRALALPVPDEYVTAPKPTEVRVGDIVKFRTQGSVKGRVTSVGTFVNFDVNGHNWSIKPHALSVIDDSREETEVSE